MIGWLADWRAAGVAWVAFSQSKYQNSKVNNAEMYMMKIIIYDILIFYFCLSNIISELIIIKMFHINA